MKKRILLILILLLIVSGCNDTKKEKENIEEKEYQIENKVELPPIEDYYDNNNTPISIYLNGKKVTEEFQTNIKVGKDIAFFKVYPSDSEYLSYNGSFGQAFHDKFTEYNKDGNLKIGYNMSYDVADGRHFEQNVIHIPDAYDYQGHILLFLYDDYDLYINKKIFKHIDIEEETDENIFSSIKLYGEAASGDIVSKITLTAFTYDDEDDFDEKGNYRGNSKYSITICQIGKTC